MFELCINLSYYKDVIFAVEITGFYLGVFYNQHEYLQIKDWGETLFYISLIFIIITLAHHYKSVFYIKYSYYASILTNIDNENDEEKGNIRSDVKYWLKDSVAQNYYNEDEDEGEGKPLFEAKRPKEPKTSLDRTTNDNSKYFE